MSGGTAGNFSRRASGMRDTDIEHSQSQSIASNLELVSVRGECLSLLVTRRD